MDRNQALILVTNVRNTYNKIASHFNLTRQKLWEDLVYFTPFIKDGQDVLDLGCGNGRLIELLGEKHINYTGVDISSNLIYEAKKREYNKNINVEFKVNDILNIDIPEKKYDLIILVAVLQHIPKAFHKEIIVKIHKSLKDNGVLLMTNWNMWQKKYIKYILVNLKIFLFGSVKKEKYGIPINDYGFKDVFVPYQAGNDNSIIAVDRYHYAFTKFEIDRLLKNNNFKILENFYTYNENKSNIYKGKNLLTIAKK